MSSPQKKIAAEPQWQKEDVFVVSKHLLDCGYHTIMIAPFDCGMAEAGKVPAKCLSNGEWDSRTGWHDAGDKPKHKNLYSFAGKYVPNLGIVTGSRTTRKGRPAIFAALDIDCLAPELVEALKAEFGESFRVRYGRPVQERSGLLPLILLLESEDAIGREKYTRNKSDKETIQLLRERKQFVAAGVHPGTGELYQWFDAKNEPADILPVKLLPVVELTRLTFLLAQHGFRPPASDKGEVTKGRLEQLLTELDGEDEQADHDALFRDDGKYPLQELIDSNFNFAALYRKGANDKNSKARMRAAKDLLRCWPAITVNDFRVFCHGWDHAGVYDAEGKNGREGYYGDREIARQFSSAEAELKSEKTPHESVTAGLGAATDGSAFAAADDENGDVGSLDMTDEESTDDISDDDLRLLYGDAAEPLETLMEKYVEARAKEKAKDKPTDKPTLTPKPLIRRSNDIARDYVPIRWLADQAIPMKSITMLFGDSNVGKTFLALHLANCARRGAPFLGRETRQCDVLYLFGEGAEGLSGRLKAYKDNHEPSDLDIAIAVKVPNLFADAKAAEKVIEMAKLAFKSSGADVGLIVIDTLQVASSGGNISEQKDMNLVFEKLRRLIDELDVAIVITHHGSKADPKNMRGSLTLREAADAVWFVEQKGTGLALTPDKLRDASKANNAMAARLQVVQIGLDENGNDVTSCIVRSDAASVGKAMTGTNEGRAGERQGRYDRTAQMGQRVVRRQAAGRNQIRLK